MKNHVVNRDKIIEAFIKEPYDNNSDSDLPFVTTESHGWQVILIIGYDTRQRDTIKIKIDKSSEKECVEYINKLGFISCS